MILSRTRPSVYLAGAMLVWGLISIGEYEALPLTGICKRLKLAQGFATVTTKTGLIFIRFILGVAESGFTPVRSFGFVLYFPELPFASFQGVWFLLSNWYRPEELSRKIAIFYSGM
jgi:hypothetical protein